MANIIELNDDNFNENIKEGISIVDFFATWCGPCKMMAPVYDKFASENNTVNFFKVDVDKAPNLTKNFAVMTVPSFIFFKDGKEVSKLIGVVNETNFKEELEKIK